MYVIEAMILRGDEIILNNKTGYPELMKCDPYYYNPLGSEHCQIISDLKTLQGLLQRIKKWLYPDNVKRLDIYECYDVYDRNSYKLLKQISM